MTIKRLLISSLSACTAGILALSVISLETAAISKANDFPKRELNLVSDQTVISIIEVCQSSRSLVDLAAEKIAGQALTLAESTKYDPFIMEAAMYNGVSPALVKAVIHAESSFDPRAVSPRGAIGLMQLMPATADMTGADNPFNPRQNIQGGTRYLKDLLEMFNGNEALAVAAYNTGPRRVQRYGGVPPFRETRNYVQRVMKYYRVYLNS